MKTKIYRKCSCGETAHDMRAERLAGGWRYVYPCRNCGKLAVNRAGLTKSHLKMDCGRVHSS